MSNYYRYTKHPVTGEIKNAEWLDNYFGQHSYGVRFPNGEVLEADKFEWETMTDEAYTQAMKEKHPMIKQEVQEDGKVVTETKHEDGRTDVNIKLTKLNIENRTPEDDIAEKKIIDVMSKKTLSVLIISKITGDHTFLRDVKQMEVRLVALQTINAYFKAQKPFTIAKIYWFSLFTYFTHPMNTFQIIEIEDEKKYPTVSTLDL